MTSDTILNLLIIVFLVLANAFFTAAEFALVRVRRTRMEELSSQGNAAAKAVREALERINLFISTAQIGITAASLALGWIGEPFLAEGIQRLFGFEPAAAPGGAAMPASTTAHVFAVASLAVALVLITFVHVVVGEQMPKLLALQFPEKMALYLIRPMRFFMALFRPLVWVLNEATLRLIRAMGLRPSPPQAGALSQEELLLLVSESKKAGVLSEDAQRMLQRVFKFQSKTVREIMVPPPDIVALELRASLEQIQSAFRQGYSRLPVYDGNLNNLKGIVYVKDLMYTLADPRLIKVVDLLRETIFVPESKAVPELLRELQKNRLHMAIVVDEFGDTAGLVTLEDIIEEIVGDIQDEYDMEPAQVERSPDGSVVFDGKTPLDRFHEIYPDFQMLEGTFETVAGLVFQIAGRVPKEADILRHGGLVFRVVKREGRRLRRISIRREAPGGVSITSVLGPAPAASGGKVPPHPTPSPAGKEQGDGQEAVSSASSRWPMSDIPPANVIDSIPAPSQETRSSGRSPKTPEGA